jgi:hypothetical protein
MDWCRRPSCPLVSGTDLWRAPLATDSQRRMLIRPLRKRRPDLAYHRQYVFLKPLTHYLRGVYFCPGRWSNDIELQSFALPLFAGGDFIYLANGKLADGRPIFEYRHREENWLQDPERASSEVCDAIENRALPEIAGLTSPEALAAQPGYGYHLEYKVLNPCFYGDYDTAQRAADSYLLYWSASRLDWIDDPVEVRKHSLSLRRRGKECYSTDFATEEDRFNASRWKRMEYLGMLLKTDRSRIPALLHDWEEFSVRSFKLEKYWTRTPFPCEERG